eukprot:3641289-Amphidinium_carterae.1
MWVCADASFAPTGEASHEGMCLIHGGASEDIFQGSLIHWKSNKQTLVTKSSCEAELLAPVSAAAETTEILGLYNAEGMKRCNEYDYNGQFLEKFDFGKQLMNSKKIENKLKKCQENRKKWQ